MPSFQLKPGEPAIFIGPMRSGKSNLIAYFVEPLSSVVIIDSKRHPDEWGAWGPKHGYVVTSDPAVIMQSPKVIYQPDMPVLADTDGFRKPGSLGYQWTQALQSIMARGNTTVVFDETIHQLPAGHPHPAAMQIMTQGAAWKISPWAGTQFANRIETSTLRAAVHCFCFRLNPFDLQLLQSMRGVNTGPLYELPDYHFGYHLTNTSEFVVCPPVEHVL